MQVWSKSIHWFKRYRVRKKLRGRGRGRRRGRRRRRRRRRRCRRRRRRRREPHQKQYVPHLRLGGHNSFYGYKVTFIHGIKPSYRRIETKTYPLRNKIIPLYCC